jgi:hypothetical protein
MTSDDTVRLIPRRVKAYYVAAFPAPESSGTNNSTRVPCPIWLMIATRPPTCSSHARMLAMP